MHELKYFGNRNLFSSELLFLFQLLFLFLFLFLFFSLFTPLFVALFILLFIPLFENKHKTKKYLRAHLRFELLIVAILSSFFLGDFEKCKFLKINFFKIRIIHKPSQGHVSCLKMLDSIGSAVLSFVEYTQTNTQSIYIYLENKLYKYTLCKKLIMSLYIEQSKN